MESPSNETLNMMIKDIKETLDNIRDENSNAHKEIKGTVETTNGRLKKLELWQAEVRGMFRAVWAVIIILASIGGFILKDMWMKYQNFDQIIQSSIQRELSRYTFTGSNVDNNKN